MLSRILALPLFVSVQRARAIGSKRNYTLFWNITGEGMAPTA
jgi:hypothetical protein